MHLEQVKHGQMNYQRQTEPGNLGVFNQRSQWQISAAQTIDYNPTKDLH